MAGSSLLPALRRLHLYFGLFISPAILFFAFTGALQSFGLHETNRDHPNYKPAHWITVLAQLHKKQTIVLPPPRKPQPAPAAAAPAAAPDATPGRTKPADAALMSTPAAPSVKPPVAVTLGTIEAKRHNPVPMRVFFVLVCVGLFTSTFTGIYMAYRFKRSRLAVSLTLVAGVVVPLLLLAF